jgi:RecJ-like exonuclease
MKCPTCDGKCGWGHYSTEHDMYARRTDKVAGSDKFFACETCKGTGEVSVTVLRQSVLAQDEWFDKLDRDLAYEAEQFHRELDRERAIEYNNRYN